MIYSTDISNILEETYPEILVDDIDRDNLLEMAKELTYGSAKIILSGNEILGSETFQNLKVKNEQQKEAIFNSQYMIYEKPSEEENRKTMTEEEWNGAIGMLDQPTPNKFVPNNFDVVVDAKKRKVRNDEPKETQIADGLFLYH